MRFYLLIFALIGICVWRIHTTCHILTQECSGSDLKIGEDYTERFRNRVRQGVTSYLPSPHSELVLGMTVGIDDLNLVPTFNDVLVKTGTIHVVVVSGYNISLVYTFILRIFHSKSSLLNLIIAGVFSLLYALISGFEAPVVRAWFMGTIIMLSKEFGARFNVIKMLVATGIVLVIVNPSYLFSLSFQLSFLATLSLVLFSEFFQTRLSGKLSKLGVLYEDLSSTLGAQVLVLPLIAYRFGRLSLISPIVNMLVLWTVSLITVLGIILIAFVFISSTMSSLVALFIYPFLDYFVRLSTKFSAFTFSEINVAVTLTHLILYYIFIFFVLLFPKIRRTCAA